MKRGCRCQSPKVRNGLVFAPRPYLHQRFFLLSAWELLPFLLGRRRWLWLPKAGLRSILEIPKSCLPFSNRTRVKRLRKTWRPAKPSSLSCRQTTYPGRLTERFGELY